MKQDRINRLIDESGLQGFDFANNDCEVNWVVALHGDKMLARRTVTTDDGSDFYCISVPYALLEATDSLYEEIITDFVETCFDVMADGSGESLSLFRDYAGANDPDLAELLAFFGRDYADFLSDIFFWYAVYLETDMMLADACDEDFPSAFTEEERLAQKVIWHLADMELTIETDDGVFYWEFAKANGRIWYHRVEVEDDGEYFLCMMPCFGSIDPNDEDSFSALRDAVIADFVDEDSEYYEVDGEVLELLNLELEDLLTDA